MHFQPYYVEKYGYKQGDYPVAENYYNRVVTLPLYPTMSDADIQYVIDTVLGTIEGMKS